MHWWMERHPDKTIPLNSNEQVSTAVAVGMVSDLIVPKVINVWTNKNKGGKYPEIMSYVY
jgi:hypothetical protein